MYKVMIVEDDIEISNAIKTSLGMWEMEAQCVDNFKNVVEEEIGRASCRERV